ncbi:MAG TPA: cytidylate kinase-like family protein [Spirochaetota bacterium]|nr:cytidylate kinase-like family protein [Spirochaetota bacterium]
MKEIFSMDSALSYQERNWKLRKKTVDMGAKKSLPFLTISREYGCLGYSVGEAIARIFNTEYRHDPMWTVYDRAIIDHLMKDMNISFELAETLTDKARNAMDYFFKTSFRKYPPEAMVYRKLVETIRILAANGHAIIIGRVGNVITSDLPQGYHVRLFASAEKKVENICNQFKVKKSEARDILAKKGEVREQFLLKHLTVDLNDPSIYNIMINTTDLTIEDTASLIIKGMENSGIIKL